MAMIDRNTALVSINKGYFSGMYIVRIVNKYNEKLAETMAFHTAEQARHYANTVELNPMGR